MLGHSGSHKLGRQLLLKFGFALCMQGNRQKLQKRGLCPKLQMTHVLRQISYAVL